LRREAGMACARPPRRVEAVNQQRGRSEISRCHAGSYYAKFRLRANSLNLPPVGSTRVGNEICEPRSGPIIGRSFSRSGARRKSDVASRGGISGSTRDLTPRRAVARRCAPVARGRRARLTGQRAVVGADAPAGAQSQSEPPVRASSLPPIGFERTGANRPRALPARAARGTRHGSYRSSDREPRARSHAHASLVSSERRQVARSDGRQSRGTVIASSRVSRRVFSQRVCARVRDRSV
jgi:hypothetical protein